MSWSRFVRLQKWQNQCIFYFICSSSAQVKFWQLLYQLELKKTLLDRMVHLLSRGYVLPVVGYIRKCLEKLNTDISLIRYFVTEVRIRSLIGLSGSFFIDDISIIESEVGFLVPVSFRTGSRCDNTSIYLRLCPAVSAHPRKRQHSGNDPNWGRAWPCSGVHWWVVFQMKIWLRWNVMFHSLSISKRGILFRGTMTCGA